MRDHKPYATYRSARRAESVFLGKPPTFRTKSEWPRIAAYCIAAAVFAFATVYVLLNVL
jgi:hypothetical protein